MNVLVTNTRAPQAYAVIRALRPHARRIVAAVEGEGRLATLAHAANSRLVDGRCRTPSPVDDWWHGRVGPDNTPAEAAYVAALLRICEQERIDVIYPSWDPFVYVLYKGCPESMFLLNAGLTLYDLFSGSPLKRRHHPRSSFLLLQLR